MIIVFFALWIAILYFGWRWSLKAENRGAGAG